jgi:hypothetical protein
MRTWIGVANVDPGPGEPFIPAEPEHHQSQARCFHHLHNDLLPVLRQVLDRNGNGSCNLDPNPDQGFDIALE